MSYFLLWLKYKLHLLFELYFTGSSRLTNYNTTQILLYILRVIHLSFLHLILFKPALTCTKKPNFQSSFARLSVF